MRYLRYIKTGSIITILGGVGFLGYEIHQTYNILSRAIDTSVVDVLEPRSKRSPSSQKYVFLDYPEKSLSIIDRFWDTITFSYARRLLNLALSDNKYIRLRAVNDLSKIKNLDDWHYSLLAHMCDAKTAVGLARCKNVDLNYFLNPPNRYVYYNHDKIVSWMKHFLISLTKCAYHPCINYFISKAFVNVQEVGRMVEHDISSVELKQCIQSADDILPLCIQSILHHSAVENFARDIVQNNGLPLLMELHKRYKNNIDINISLVKIMANISVYPELLQDIYRSGWVGVLAKFLKHDDIRLSGPAAKALANLDTDDNLDGKFVRKIYLLHPVNRSQISRDVDVILVHGLLGGVFFTWRQRDRVKTTSGFLGKKKKDDSLSSTSSNAPGKIKTSDFNTKEYLDEVEERKKIDWCEIGKDFEVILHDCPNDCSDDGPYSCPGEEICKYDDRSHSQCWPMDWLPHDCPNIRILGINYDTNLSLWAPMCPIDNKKNTMDERSDDFLEKLVAAGVGNKPIIWLTHSMGGLLVKDMLVKAKNSQNENVRRMCNNTKGIVFFSTPHKGTHVATINQTACLFVWPSIEVRQLREGCPQLLMLHNNFLNLLEETKIKILSFVETQYTTITPLKIQFYFVPVHSAKLNYGEYYEMPLDHLRICKPFNRYSFLYRKVVMFIQDILNERKDINSDDYVFMP